MRKQIKRYVRKSKSKLQFWIKPLSIEDMRRILTDDLDIKPGDKLFVTSGFGGLNATFSPKELAQLLMDIVSSKGMIVMPYYPPGSSFDWANSGAVFDMNQTKSSTGVLSNVFSKMPGVLKSMHPTKSVCVWGDGAEELIADHITSRTPFSGGSPYDKLLKINNMRGGVNR